MIIGGLVAGFLIFSFLGLFTSSFARIIAVALTTSIGFFIGKADPRSSKTVLNLIMDAKAWRLSQRRFLYIYGREQRYHVKQLTGNFKRNRCY